MPFTSPYWRRRREFLRTLPLFAASTEEELRAFDRVAGEIWVDRGGDLIHEGARGVDFAVIAEGRVVVARGGEEVATLGPGDFVGELALLDGRARTATVTAATRARLLVLGVDGFETVLREVPSVRVPVEAAAAVRRQGVPVVPAPALTRPAGPRRGLRRRRAVLMAVACVSIAGVTGWGWVMRERTRTTEVELADALADFRAATYDPTKIPEGGTPAEAAASPASGTDDPAPAAAAAVPGSVTPQAAPATSLPPLPFNDGHSMPAAAPPVEGVYPYATDGWESISMLGGRHDYPSRTYSVVRHAGGCRWEIEHRIVDEHVDRRGRCTEPTAFAVLFEAREIEFFSKRDGLRYDCDPASSRVLLADAPGTVRRSTCRSDDGDALHITARREQPEPLAVGSVRVDAVRVHLDMTMSGRATGTAAVDFWLHPSSGLILKEHRVTDTQANAVFGDVRYREEVTLRLETLTPAR